MGIEWRGTPNYSSGNSGRLYLFPHICEGWYEGSISTLQNPTRQASAHYVIDGDKIAQLVDEKNTAWHCGNRWYNWRSISYELCGTTANPPSKSTLDTCAGLMADASKRYFGGAKLVLGSNVMLHKMVYATSCPATTDIDYLISKANEILGKGGSAPSYSGGGSSSSSNNGSLDVDGFFGPKTVRKCQSYLGTTIDGVVSGQDSGDMSRVNRGGLPAGTWQIGSGGSNMVRAIQRKIGSNPDGFFGVNTCKSLQKYLGTTVDGYVSGPSSMVKELQRRLNAGTF